MDACLLLGAEIDLARHHLFGSRLRRS